MKRPHGMGVVGAGVVFEQHARACEPLADRVLLVGVAELNANKRRNAASRWSIPVATEDYRELLERDDVNLIAVCTPPSHHEEVVIAALEAGKYVICEKPLAHTLESADRIIRASRDYADRLTVVYQLRYLPEVQRLVWLRDQGHLGRLLVGRFTRYDRLRGAPGGSSGWWGRWAIAGGGAVISQFIHELDLMPHLFGPATQVTAVMDTLSEDIESEDSFVAMVRFAGGSIASCTCTSAAQQYRVAYDVIAERATVRYPWALECADPQKLRTLEAEVLRRFPGRRRSKRAPVVVRLVKQLPRRLGLIRKSSPLKPGPHTPYLRAVLDAVDAGRAMPVPPEEARASLELCTAIYTSALTQRPVSLPLEPANPYYGGIRKEEYQTRRHGASSAGLLPDDGTDS